MKQRAFTLLELLAVIVILAVLAALLFPQAGKMMARAGSAKFTSNLRTVASALMSLAADNDGTIPAFADLRFSPIHWQERVAPYLGEDPLSSRYKSAEGVLASALHDPADKTVCALYGTPLPQRCVAINGATALNASGQSIDPSMGTAMGVTNRKLGSIERPSQLMLIGPGTSAQFSNVWGLCARFSNDNFDQVQRYPEGMYFAFVDGHVALKSRAWVEYEIEHGRNFGKSAFFDASATNEPPLDNPTP